MITRGPEWDLGYVGMVWIAQIALFRIFLGAVLSFTFDPKLQLVRTFFFSETFSVFVFLIIPF